MIDEEKMIDKAIDFHRVLTEESKKFMDKNQEMHVLQVYLIISTAISIFTAELIYNCFKKTPKFTENHFALVDKICKLTKSQLEIIISEN